MKKTNKGPKALVDLLTRRVLVVYTLHLDESPPRVHVITVTPATRRGRAIAEDEASKWREHFEDSAGEVQVSPPILLQEKKS